MTTERIREAANAAQSQLQATGVIQSADQLDLPEASFAFQGSDLQGYTRLMAEGACKAGAACDALIAEVISCWAFRVGFMAALACSHSAELEGIAKGAE